MKVLIGIDPGKSGGIAYLYKGQVRTTKMPEGAASFEEFMEYLKTLGQCFVFMEKVNMFNADFENRGKSFQLQKLFGQQTMMKTVLETSKIPYVLVPAVTWQKVLNLGKRKGTQETVTERKNRFKTAAQKHYPGIKVTHFNADALHLLSFGNIKLQSDKDWITKRIPQPIAEKLI